MSAEIKLDDIDVKRDPSPAIEPDEDKKVEPKSGEDDDKSKNFANLRKKVSDLEAENERLRKAQEDKKPNRDLENKNAEETKVSEVLFKRDMKEAVRLWNKKNNVSTDEWNEIKGKVHLSGDETVSEIQDKIDEAFENLPSTKKKREKELIDKGRKEAMGEFQDDEMDIGGSGDDTNHGSSSEPVFNSREKRFLQAFGVTSEEQKKINKDGNSNQWQEGKSPTKKFFEGAK